MFRRAIFAAGLLAAAITAAPAQDKTAKAIFAGGCFWCVEADFDKVPGVISTTSGYINGTVKNPNYKQVSAGGTGHAEVVEIVYDPAKVTFAKLLDVFWRNIDPTQADGQFCDIGESYRSAIFTLNEEQKKLAEESKVRWTKQKPFRQPLLTPITKAATFYAAEDYHQDYYKKNALQYKFYVTGCGRYARLDSLWGSLRKK